MQLKLHTWIKMFNWKIDIKRKMCLAISSKRSWSQNKETKQRRMHENKKNENQESNYSGHISNYQGCFIRSTRCRFFSHASWAVQWHVCTCLRVKFLSFVEGLRAPRSETEWKTHSEPLLSDRSVELVKRRNGAWNNVSDWLIAHRIFHAPQMFSHILLFYLYNLIK